MLNLDPNTLHQVVNRAKQAAADEPRWLNAIDKAAEQLQVNPYIARQDGHLLIGSPSGQVYSSNGVCQCKAYENGRPCWHRAAARLVQRHDEAAQQPAQPLGDRLAARRKALAEMDELFA